MHRNRQANMYKVTQGYSLGGLSFVFKTIKYEDKIIYSYLVRNYLRFVIMKERKLEYVCLSLEQQGK